MHRSAFSFYRLPPALPPFCPAGAPSPSRRGALFFCFGSSAPQPALLVFPPSALPPPSSLPPPPLLPPVRGALSLPPALQLVPSRSAPCAASPCLHQACLRPCSRWWLYVPIPFLFARCGVLVCRLATFVSLIAFHPLPLSYPHLRTSAPPSTHIRIISCPVLSYPAMSVPLIRSSL